jgi:hypothetical protein
MSPVQVSSGMWQSVGPSVKKPSPGSADSEAVSIAKTNTAPALFEAVPIILFPKSPKKTPTSSSPSILGLFLCGASLSFSLLG